jgi:hypothetical protein
MEQLRKRLADAEMKNARLTHDVSPNFAFNNSSNLKRQIKLNKEISELETLVESKVRLILS